MGAALDMAADRAGIVRIRMLPAAAGDAQGEAEGDALIAALETAFAGVEQDRSARAVVLTRFGALTGVAPPKAPRLPWLIDAVCSCSRPVIAHIDGEVAGAAAAVIAACDIAIAGENSTFAFSGFGSRSTPPEVIERIVAAIGLRQAQRFVLTGERFDAETARRIGLVHMVAMEAQLDATIEGFLSSLPDRAADEKAGIRSAMISQSCRQLWAP